MQASLPVSVRLKFVLEELEVILGILEQDHDSTPAMTNAGDDFLTRP